MNPWPGAYTDWNGKVMKLWSARVCKPQSGTGNKGADEERAVPGTIIEVEKDGFYVQTGDGLLKITELQIPGKKKMDAAAFLRGYKIQGGEAFVKKE